VAGFDQLLPAVLRWVDSHVDEALADLTRFCQQPSVAAQNLGMADMARLAERALLDLGAKLPTVATSGYPVIVGQFSGESPYHLLVYDHYDVQPAEPLDQWLSPPFEPEIRHGAFYARGVADNKGNLVARLWAIRAWQAIAGTLPCRVTCLFEGEEETGSPHLGEFAAAHPDLVHGDGCLWESGYRDEHGTLSIYAGVKGMLYVELHAHGVAFDLHSSEAPLAPNAIWRLTHALATLCDSDQHVLIPGFYGDVRPPTGVERDLMARFPIDPEARITRWTVPRLLGGDLTPAEFTERLLYSPTCNIAGIWGGYTGPGSKTVLPAHATAKLDIRLVPDQRPERILEQLRIHLHAHGFDEIEVVQLETAELPAQSDLSSALVRALADSARAVYGTESGILPRTAGTGPMEQLCQRYGVPAVGGAGVGHSLSRVHSPNENIFIEDFVLGIKHVAALLATLAVSS